MAQGTDYIIRYLSDISDAVKGAKTLQAVNSSTAQKIQAQYGQVVRVLGQLPTKIQEIPIKVNGKDAIKTIQTVGEIVQTANGSFLEMTKTQTLVQGQLVKTAGGVKDVTNQFIKGNIEAEKGAKVFTNFADNVKQLAGRALLTIPIWIALRASIQGVFSTVSNGIKDLISFDLALQKIRNNLSGTPEEVANNFNKIKNSITEASKATGISTEELANAVKQFATLGFSANESLQGALGASKLSIALFGDAGDTAEAFAKALNILIDRSQGAKTSVDQMNEAFALTSQLEQTNNFEIKSVTEALNKFGGTAAGVGLTMNQTLQILAALGTAGRTGSEGATLLSTSFNTLLKSLPKLSQTLGITTTAGESTFTTFRKVLDVIVKLNSTPGGRSAAIEGISDIFGGARGIKIVQSLVAVKSILDANIATIPDFEALNSKVARTLESESGQAKILGNNLKEAGKSLVTAAVGGGDFTESLKNINNGITNVSKALNFFGTSLNSLFGTFGSIGLTAATAFVLTFRNTATVQAIFASLVTAPAILTVVSARLGAIFAGGFLGGMRTIGIIAGTRIAAGLAFAGTAITGALTTVFSLPGLLVAVSAGALFSKVFSDNYIAGLKREDKNLQGAWQKVIDGLRGNLAIPDLKVLINKLSIEAKPGDQAAQTTIVSLKKQLQKQIELGTVEAKVPVEIAPIVSFKNQQEISKILLGLKLDELKAQGASNVEVLKASDAYSNQLGIVNNLVERIQKRVDLEKAITEEQIKLRDIQKGGVITSQIESLRVQGATNVQLIQARNELEKNLKINQTKEQLLTKQLELEQAITAEKIGQNSVASNETKLYEIAQENGIQTARAIQDVLSGEKDFDVFVKQGGANLEIFKNKFADIFKTQQTNAFFRGDVVPGLNDVRGGSSLIPSVNLSPGVPSLPNSVKNAPEQTLNIKLDGKNISLSAGSAEELKKKLQESSIKETLIDMIVAEVNKDKTPLAEAVDNRILEQ